VDNIAVKTDAFLVGVNGEVLTASDDYHTKRAIDKVDQSFNNLKEARGFATKAKKMSPELEELFQMVGKGLIQLSRDIKRAK